MEIKPTPESLTRAIQEAYQARGRAAARFSRADAEMSAAREELLEADAEWHHLIKAYGRLISGLPPEFDVIRGEPEPEEGIRQMVVKAGRK